LLVGVAPLWFFLLVLYRELSVTFLRTLTIQKGVVLAASSGGKLKAWLYFFASLGGLLRITWPGLVADEVWFWGLNGLFVIAALQSALSFAQYLRGYFRLARKGS
jgi:CDP-diacylglycerol--glycerol-3-phosphate 3-phosphatidyltransferase